MWRWWAGNAALAMLIVFLPLWQIVTFLPYALSAELTALWAAPTPPSATRAASRQTTMAAAPAMRERFFLGLLNWAPFSSC